jgi:hypothetical protein
VVQRRLLTAPTEVRRPRVRPLLAGATEIRRPLLTGPTRRITKTFPLRRPDGSRTRSPGWPAEPPNRPAMSGRRGCASRSRPRPPRPRGRVDRARRRPTRRGRRRRSAPSRKRTTGRRRPPERKLLAGLAERFDPAARAAGASGWGLARRRRLRGGRGGQCLRRPPSVAGIMGRWEREGYPHDGGGGRSGIEGQRRGRVVDSGGHGGGDGSARGRFAGPAGVPGSRLEPLPETAAWGRAGSWRHPAARSARGAAGRAGGRGGRGAGPVPGR